MSDHAAWLATQSATVTVLDPASASSVTKTASMRLADRPELNLGFRQSDVQAGLARGRASKEKAQSKRGLAGTGRPLDQIHPLGGKAAMQDVIEACDAGGRHIVRLVLWSHNLPRLVVDPPRPCGA